MPLGRGQVGLINQMLSCGRMHLLESQDHVNVLIITRGDFNARCKAKQPGENCKGKSD